MLNWVFLCWPEKSVELRGFEGWKRVALLCWTDGLNWGGLTKSNFRPMVFTENTRQLGSEAVEGIFHVTADILTTQG